MKLTRYFQSCLLIEDVKARILIDPSGQEKDRIDDFGQLDAVLYTHEHGDHFDAEMAQAFVEQGIAPVYANASTAKLIKASRTIVKDGQEFIINGLRIKVLELPHCLMVDGNPGPQNTGYLVGGSLFHPGDGVKLEGLSVDNLALPIAGPDISLKDAFDFAKQTSAKKVVPIHYDYLGGNPDFFATVANKHGIKTQILKNGESTEI
jgi:L-ascorbate metabolism protein UlaG (beta-lactamase superfamily)